MILKLPATDVRARVLGLTAILVSSMVIGYWLGNGWEAGSPVGAQAQLNHHVVYLAAQVSAGDLTPQRLTTDIGASVVTTWQEVISANSNMELDALIIDPGSLSLVDWEWLKSKYRVGLVVVGINIHLSVLGTMLEESEFAAEPPASWAGEFYSIAHASRNGTSVSLTAIAQDPSHQPTGNDWVNEYLYGNESDTGPSPSANVEPGSTAYFFLLLSTELDQQDDLDVLVQP